MAKGSGTVRIKVLMGGRETDEAGNGDWARLWVGTEC